MYLSEDNTQLEAQLKVVKISAFTAFLIPMLLTRDLWFSHRDFPMVPFFTIEIAFPFFVDIALILFFIISFCIHSFFNHKWSGYVVVFIYVLWSLLDQNRIQPYFFELILVILALLGSNSKTQRQCLLLIFVGTYVWSGLHKYNELFFDKWLGGLDKRIPFTPYWMRVSFTYAIPFLEAAFGLGLCFAKTRKYAVVLISLMHAIILITFISDGNGYTVFPLTIFNVFTLFYVFFKDRKPLFENLQINLFKAKRLFFVFWMLLLPAFNLLGTYDHILAFSYFSGKPSYARIVFDKNEVVDKLPQAIQVNLRKHEGYYYVDLNEWASRTIRVLVYPEKRVYYKIQNKVNEFTLFPTTLQFY